MAKTWNVSEARRDLSRLVRGVVHGTGPVMIGPRGRPAAVLLAAEDYNALKRRAVGGRGDRMAPIRLEIVGSPDDLDEEVQNLRAEISGGIERRDARKRTLKARR
jgi:prevent-host-death family protein